MGNQHGQSKINSNSSDETDGQFSPKHLSSTKGNTLKTACLSKLFEKLEQTAEGDNSHPGEITRITFENAFHGPLHKFGALFYQQMCSGTADRDRATREQFIKAGKEVLKLFDESAQQKYYFKLFAGGKDHLTKDDTIQMVDVSYALTLASSKISYSKTDHDDRVFDAVVSSMFGIKDTVTYDIFSKWLHWNCPHMFCGVHNWVYTILTGSKLPAECETTPVPQLERFGEGKSCLSMGSLWLLSATMPPVYTHCEGDTPGLVNPMTGNDVQQAVSGEISRTRRNDFFGLFQARLSQCQSWTLLYDSTEHGQSLNRFSYHVSSYFGPTVTLFSFEGRNLYCVAEDTGWREGTTRFGGDDTMIIQVTPIYKVIQARGPLVMWNDHARDIPKGISIGKDGRSTVLCLPKDFDKVKHYGVECNLNKVEVWGCGSTKIHKAQIQQKTWEKRDVEKQASRKLRLETTWDENPDKQLLQWGGVEVNHQHSRQGGW
ncbi:hypothetical protein ScPMuIL_006604 [Solemya velum]